MLSSESLLLTNKGTRPLSYFRNGERVLVVSKSGKWVKATIRHVGKRVVNKILINRQKSKEFFYATPDHRWILETGKTTEELEKGEKLLKAPNIARFNYDLAPRIEKQFWCMGFMYRNGNKLKDGSCVIVNHDQYKYNNRFKKAGFTAKPSPLFEYEYNCYMEGYFRDRFEIDSIPVVAVRAFVNGYVDAFAYDKGSVFRDAKDKLNHRYLLIEPFDSEFIKQILPMAGFYIATESMQGQRTKLNVCHYDPQNPFQVKSIEKFGSMQVSQVDVVEEEHTFALPFGVITRCS